MIFLPRSSAWRYSIYERYLIFNIFIASRCEYCTGYLILLCSFRKQGYFSRLFAFRRVGKEDSQILMHLQATNRTIQSYPESGGRCETVRQYCFRKWDFREIHSMGGNSENAIGIFYQAHNALAIISAINQTHIYNV